MKAPVLLPCMVEENLPHADRVGTWEQDRWLPPTVRPSPISPPEASPSQIRSLEAALVGVEDGRTAAVSPAPDPDRSARLADGGLKSQIHQTADMNMMLLD